MDSVLIASTECLEVPEPPAHGLAPLADMWLPGFESGGSRVYLDRDGWENWRRDFALDEAGHKHLAEGLAMLGATEPSSSWEVLFSGSLVALHRVLSYWLTRSPVVVWDDAGRVWMLPVFLDHVERIGFDHNRLLDPPAS